MTTESAVTETAGTTKEQATQVAGTAKEQAAQVVGEAMDQAHDLVGQATEQINAQATDQTRRLSGNLRRLAQQLTTMADAGETGSTAHSLVRHAADHAERAAGYLDGKQPGELVNDLQGLGRRRPGAFLAGAAIAGAVVGRVASAAKKASGEAGTTDAGTTDAGATASRSTGAGSAHLPNTTAPVADPTPPVRNVPPGAATVEPYPDATADAAVTTAPVGSR